MSFTNVINKLKAKTNLNEEDLSIIFHDFKNKKLNDEDIKNLIISWREKGETPLELNYLANLVNTKQNQNTSYKDAIDMCGTGGDKLNTFNISTISAIVASSCGAKVIKHSGRSTTSISGSVDILNEFGLNLDETNTVKEDCFKKTGLMFVSSKIFRETFGQVKRVCKSIDIPGFINLLGPLTNPYKTDFHLLGVSKLEWGDLMASALKLARIKKAIVVCCEVTKNVYLDEFSSCGTNYIWKISDSKIEKETISNSDLGVKKSSLNNLVINNKTEAKNIFESILKGEDSKEDTCAKIETVALNTGAALFLTGRVKSLNEGYEFALKHIFSGKSWEHFSNFMNCNKMDTLKVVIE